MSFLFKHKVNGQTSFIKTSAVKYAIGEVILIFIGITLAIAFNNWNEQRKQSREGEQYIRQIYEDLKNDQVTLETIFHELEAQATSAQYLLRILESPGEVVPDRKEFSDAQLNLAFTVVPQRIENTFDELKTSGKLGFLSNEFLTESLYTYYAYYDSRIINFNELPKQVRLELRRIGASTGSLEEAIDEVNGLPFSERWVEEFLHHPDIPKLVVAIFKSSFYNKTWFEELDNQAQSIIEYMEEEYAKVLNR